MERRNANIAKYWPPVVREMRDFREIATGENPEFSALWNAVERFLRDTFVHTATEYAIARWERIFKLTAYPGDTLNDRRARILAIATRELPYTMRALRNMLTTILGAGHFTATVNPVTATLTVLVSVERSSQMEDVRELLAVVAPANLGVVLAHQYATHGMLTGRTHGELAAYTHKAIRETLITEQ